MIKEQLKQLKNYESQLNTRLVIVKNEIKLLQEICSHDDVKVIDNWYGPIWICNICDKEIYVKQLGE